MKLLNLFTIVVFVLNLSFLNSANAELNIEISGGGAHQIPVAILPFAETSGLPTKEMIHKIVAADLRSSGLFRLLDTSGMPNLPTTTAQISYPEWSALQAQAMTVGNIQAAPGGDLNITYTLVDVLKKTQLISMSYQIKPSQVRATAHKIADAIFEKLTGQPGAFSSRIAYIKKIGSRYTLQVADADGYNSQTMVNSKEPLISPAWSPDGSKMAYVSFEKKKPIIYVQSLTTGERKVLANYKGNNSAPTWSPDGNKLAIVLTYGANSQIYTIDANGGNLKRITNSRAIDTEPAFSPDGQYIYFTSDRGGKPQIYKTNANGGDVSRVTFEGAYNVSPHFSPDGRYLTYIRNDGGRFKVAVQDLTNGQVQLLSEGSLDESPSFSPNSRVVLYATRVGGRGALASVSVDGAVRQRLSETSGDVRESSWGPRIK